MRIRIEAPSSPFPVEKLNTGVARLREAGHVVDDAPALRALEHGRHAYLTTDDEERRRSLREAISSDVDVVWLARGGYGLTRIVSRLDVPSKSPLVIGFSDATALFAAQPELRAVHGPLATTIGFEPQWTFDHALAVLERRAKGAAFDVHVDDNPRHGDVDVEGPLFAANLCVLAAVCGTPAMPSLEGSILVLEEVGERPYRIDRMLTQLKEAGAFADVRAVIAGHLTGCAEPAAGSGAASGKRDPAPAPLDVFRERIRSTGVPFAHSLAVGHEAPNIALPIGARARLAGGKLTLLEDVRR
jgi:muramoyltetrapeptide carboxypeptidase